MKRMAIVSAVVLGLAGGAVILVAGPLNPPAGAVSSTYKTLTEVEPRIAINATNTPGDATSVFKITQPGSYYLTGNITGVSAKHGIEIAANDVTIDLNGYALRGVTGSLDGIGATTVVQNTAIVNGTINGWGDDGIDLLTTTCLNTRVQGVTASNNGGDGITLYANAVVRDSIAYLNGGNGISVSVEGVIEDCVAKMNTANGIVLGAVGVVSRCESRNNGSDGIQSTSNGYSSIFDCTSVDNGGNGIRVYRGTLVTRNNCSFNGAGGIFVTGPDNRIESNTLSSNTRGVDVDSSGNIIVKNTCSGSSAANWDIVVGNVILVVNATTAGAFTGNSGGAAPGSADPNANFTY